MSLALQTIVIIVYHLTISMVICQNNSMNEYRVITGLWQDDFALRPYLYGTSTSNDIGWLIKDDLGNDKAVIYGSNIIDFTSSYYYFNGDDLRSNERIYMNQSFFCNVPSSVSISYFAVFCATEHTDHIKLYVNDDLIVQTKGIKEDGIAVSDYNLEALSGCSPWQYVVVNETECIQFVDVNEVFNVLFDIRITANNEGFGIKQIEIECNPFWPTIEPTKKPFAQSVSVSTTQFVADLDDENVEEEAVKIDILYLMVAVVLICVCLSVVVLLGCLTKKWKNKQIGIKMENNMNEPKSPIVIIQQNDALNAFDDIPLPNEQKEDDKNDDDELYVAANQTDPGICRDTMPQTDGFMG